MPSVDTTALN